MNQQQFSETLDRLGAMLAQYEQADHLFLFSTRTKHVLIVSSN
jgi:hypothetical protein